MGADRNQWQFPRNVADNLLGWRADGKGLENKVPGVDVGDMAEAIYDPQDIGGDAFDRKNWGEFDTKSAAQSASVPSSVHAIRLYGDVSAGDGYGSVYIDSDNGSADTFTSNGGNRTWYRAPTETPISWSFADTSSGGIRIGRDAGVNIPEFSVGNDSKSHLIIGHGAAKNTTRARACIVAGYDAGSQGQLGFANILIGESAGRNVTSPSSATSETQGTRNLMIGTLAGYFNTTGNANHFIGRDAGHANTTGNNRVALGYIALGGHNPIGLSGAIESQAPTTASEDVFVGYLAGRYNNGDKSVGVGTLALGYVKDGSRNSALGANALDDLDVDTWFGGNAISRVSISGTYSQTGTTVTVTATASGAVAGRKASVTFTSGAISSVTTEAQYVTVASKPDANTFTFTSAVSQTASGNCTVDWVETTTPNGNSEYNSGIGFGIGDGLKIGSRNLLLGALAGDVNTFNSGGSTYSNRLVIGTQSSGAPLIVGDFVNGYVSINGVNADLLHPFQVRLRSSGAELFRVGSDSAMRLISADATANAGPIFSLDRNSASPAANDIIGSFRYLGRDSAGNETNYADIFGTIVDPTNGSEDATLSFRSMVAASIGVRLNIGGGLYHPLATGGDKGDNSINFGAVYDDNVLLTCYPIEAANTGAIDLAAWDAVAANGKHDAARRFAAERMNMLDVDQFIAFWRENGHLPSLPSREGWAEHAKDKLSTGEMIQRLWETVDLLAVHIAQIRKETA